MVKVSTHPENGGVSVVVRWKWDWSILMNFLPIIPTALVWSAFIATEGSHPTSFSQVILFFATAFPVFALLHAFRLVFRREEITAANGLLTLKYRGLFGQRVRVFSLKEVSDLRLRETIFAWKGGVYWKYWLVFDYRGKNVTSSMSLPLGEALTVLRALDIGEKREEPWTTEPFSPDP